MEQFCSSLHQEVAYEGMARMHRRTLLLRAARVVKQQLASASSLVEARPLWRSLAAHLLNSVRRNRRKTSDTGEASATGHSFMRMTPGSLRSLADALEGAAQNSQTLGDYAEAMSYRVSHCHL